MNSNSAPAAGLSRGLLLVLAAVTAAGAALRFIGLDLQSFWNDELFSVNASLTPGAQDVVARIRGDGHPPGYQLLLWAVLKLFGNDETVARLPSAIAGTLSIPAMFLLGRRVYGDREGLVAAAMFAVGWIPVYYSQEARSYATLILATILAVWGWLGSIRSQRLRSLDAATLLLAGLVAAWFHYFGLLVVLLLGAATLLLVILRRVPWKLLVPFALIGVGWLPCVSSFLFDLRYSKKPHIVTPGLREALRDQIQFFFATWSLANIAVALLVIGAIAHLWRARHQIAAVRTDRVSIGADSRPGRFWTGLRALGIVSRGTWFLLAWFTGTLFLVWIQSKVSTPVLTTRNLLVVLPPFLLLLARAACIAFDRPVARWVLPIVFVALIGSEIPRKGYYTKPHKQQWRETVAAVVEAERTAGPGTPLMFGSAWEMQYFTYYFERNNWPQQVERVPDTTALLERVEAERPERVWILWGHLEAPPEARAALVAHGYRVAKEIGFVATGAWLFIRDADR